MGHGLDRRAFVAGTLGLALAGRTSSARAQVATPADGPAAAGTPVSTIQARPPLPPGAELVATGLNNPRSLVFGPDGALYVAEAGSVGDGPCVEGPEGDPECYGSTGAIARIGDDGTVERIVAGLGSRAIQDTGAQATGPHDLAFVDGELYVLTGVGADPAVRTDLGDIGTDLAKLLRVVDGGTEEVADIGAFETSDNPDGNRIDANPYAMVPLPEGGFAVVDAGANALLRVGADGAIETLAVFPPTPATGPDGSEMPMEAVPNALALGPDGNFYVGQLTGFPFTPGAASVWRVPAAGGEPEVVADGFTNLIDVAFDADGALYALEWNRGGILNINPDDPSTLEGQLTRLGTDGTRTVLAGPGLVLPTAVAIGPDGAIYVTVFGAAAGAATLVRLPAGAGAGEAATPGSMATPEA